MLLRLLVSIIFSFFSLNAVSKTSDDIYINAYIGVGYAYESGNNFLGSNKNENRLIESALSLTYEYNNNVSFDGQIAYREFGEYFTDKAPRMDYAQINYTDSFIDNSEQSLSIGRIKIPIGVYNLSRDTPVTRPSLIMPQSTYLDLFRNIWLSTDGLMLSSSHQISQGIIDINLGYGKLNIDDNFSDVILGSDTSGDWRAEEIFIADMRYNSVDWLFGISYNHVQPGYLSSPNDQLPLFPVGNNISPIINGKVDVKSYTTFIQYNMELFEFTGEYTYRDVIVSGFTPTPPNSRPMEGYYAQLKYAASPYLNLTMRYDQLYRFADHKSGLETPVGPYPAWYNNSKTYSVGFNYNINEHWNVIADIHYVEGSAWLPPFSYQVPESVEKKHWTLAAFEIIYIF
jgi:hypothetical protein